MNMDAHAAAHFGMFEKVEGGKPESCSGCFLPTVTESGRTSVSIRAVQYFIVSTEADMLTPTPSPFWLSSYLPNLITNHHPFSLSFPVKTGFKM